MRIYQILRRIFYRLAAAVPALIGVVVFTFILMRVMPGDPAIFFASGPTSGEEEIQEIRRQLGLDKPILVQLVYYLGDIATGNLGLSLTTGQAVTTDLINRLPASLELTFFALLIALTLSIPLGVVAALHPNSLIDHIVRFVCTLGVCVPMFVSGLMLIYVFYYTLGWSPDPTGRFDIFSSAPPRVTGFLLVDSLLAQQYDSFASAFSRLILPGATMALFVLSPLTRMTRASMLAVLGGDIVRTGEAAGLPRQKIIVVYALRNAILPPHVLPTSGIVLSSMLGANILVEKVFSWPGIASYALNGLLASDYAAVQGFVLLMAGLCVAINLLVDILYGIGRTRGCHSNEQVHHRPRPFRPRAKSCHDYGGCRDRHHIGSGAPGALDQPIRSDGNQYGECI